MPWIQGVWELKHPQRHNKDFKTEAEQLIYFGPTKTPLVPLVHAGELFMYNPLSTNWALLTVKEVDATNWEFSGAGHQGKIKRTREGISLYELSFYGPTGGGVVLDYQRQGTREEERTGHALLLVFAVFLVAWYIAAKH